MRDGECDVGFSTGTVTLPGFDFDLDVGELRDSAGEPVPLRPQCVAVLRCLAESLGRIVFKEDLMRTVWPGVVVTDDSLVQCIRELRHALGDADHRVVRTEHRRGYRLVPASVVSIEPSLADGFAEEVRFATSHDGVRIAYACRGNGVPVVRAARFISHLDYDFVCLTEGPILQAVARRHRLVRFDQRGQGLSDRHVGAGTLDDSVSDLRAVVDAAGLSRFVLWSIGGGAASAVRFAVRYPERVERLIISAGWTRGMAIRKDPRWIAAGEEVMKIYEAFWNASHMHVRRLGLLERQYPSMTVEQRSSYDQMLRDACSGFSAASAFRASMYFDVTDDLGNVRCPTLVTRSQRDLVTPFEEVRLLVAGIPRARLVMLDSADHMPLPQAPAFDELVHAMERFIGESELTHGDRQTTEQTGPATGTEQSPKSV